MPSGSASETAEARCRGIQDRIGGRRWLFIAKEIGRDSVDLLAMFALHGRALHGMVSQMIIEQPRARR